MRARLERWIDALRTGFWFVPLVMLLGACGLAVGLLALDERVDPGLKATLTWAYTGGPEGARSLLSTVAGSMITAASVTFSLASVALSIASQQYGSRVLRNFMRDRVTQVLLGIFVSTFIYSVLVVRAIRGSDAGGGFVPAVSVTVAIGLSVVSLMMLIYFVHHVSASIQASHIVKVIAKDMEESIPRLYPSGTGEGRRAAPEMEFRQGASMTVAAPCSGYLQTIDLDTLMGVAGGVNGVIEVAVKPGDFVIEEQRLATVWGVAQMDDKAAEKVTSAFYLGGERTAAQDIRYQFQQLTDVVVRALSPGINDPFTAVNGIDELASGLVLFARRARAKEVRMDEQGRVRLHVPTPSLSEVMEQTVGHMAVYGAGDPFVMAALRRALDAVEPMAREGDERRVVERLREDLSAREQAKAKEAGVA